jgi:hypothetical protein
MNMCTQQQCIVESYKYFLQGARDVVQMVEHLPSKYKAPSSNLNTTKKNTLFFSGMGI